MGNFKKKGPVLPLAPVRDVPLRADTDRRYDFPDMPTHIDPTHDHVFTPVELEGLGVKGRSMQAVQDHLNARGKRATAGMTEAQKTHYLVEAMAKDWHVSEDKPGDNVIKQLRRWYDDDARHLEHGLADRYGYTPHRDDPDQVFAKMLVGMTSPGTDPHVNVDTVVRMLDHAKGDVLKVPPHQGYLLDALHHHAPWLTEGLSDLSVHERAKWAHDNGHRDGTKTPWQTMPGVYDRKTKRLVGLIHGTPGKPEARLISPRDREEDDPIHELAFDPVDSPPDLIAHVHGLAHLPVRALRAKHKGRYERVAVPMVKGGKLKHKGWGNNADVLGTNLIGLQNMIRGMGRRRAAAFLTREHDAETVKKVRMRYWGRPTGEDPGSYLPEGDRRVAGFLVLGPKIGSFAANIHDSVALGKYLTADMWWARAFRRHLGEIKGGKEEIGEEQRRQMYDVAQALMRRVGAKSIAELQAGFWGTEQALYRRFGLPTDTGRLSTGFDVAEQEAEQNPFEKKYAHITRLSRGRKRVKVMFRM